MPIPKDRIGAEWWRISLLLGPAIDVDPGASREAVKGWLLSGQSEAFWVGVQDNATGIGVTTIGPIDGTEVCWVNYIAGTVTGGPKAFVRTAHAIMDQIEILARQAGCAELRGGGRNWSRVFPEWERFDPAHPNRIRKVIAHG